VQLTPQAQINTETNIHANSQAELMSSIDEALKEAPPSDIMTNRVFSEVMYYITPVISILAFILIIALGLIPNAGIMNDNIQQINALKEEEAALKARVVKLNTLRSNIIKMDAIIEKINAIVPEGTTEVVRFAQKIRSAINVNMERYEGDIREPPLSMEDIQTGETELTTVAVKVTGLKVSQVPTEFGITGGLQRLRQFFMNLYGGSDFFVVEKMDLVFDQVEKEWTGDVSLVKYQFNKDPTFDAETIYGAISEDTQPNAKVLAYLESKFVENILNEN